MALIMRQKIVFRCFFKSTHAVTRSLKCSRPLNMEDDFFGLNKKSSVTDEDKKRETRSNLEKTLSRVNPRDFVVDERQASRKGDVEPGVFSLPYGFVRYDSPVTNNSNPIHRHIPLHRHTGPHHDRHEHKYSEREIQHSNIPSHTNIQDTVSHYSDSSETERRSEYPNGVENITNLPHKYTKSMNVKYSSSQFDTGATDSDLNFIDNQFFKYDPSQTEDVNTSLKVSETTDNANNFGQTDLSFIDSQYFEKESSGVGVDYDNTFYQNTIRDTGREGSSVNVASVDHGEPLKNPIDKTVISDVHSHTNTRDMTTDITESDRNSQYQNSHSMENATTQTEQHTNLMNDNNFLSQFDTNGTGSDLNFIDHQFFHYEPTQTKDVDTSFRVLKTNNDTNSFEQTEIPLVNSQYFEEESSGVDVYYDKLDESSTMDTEIEGASITVASADHFDDYGVVKFLDDDQYYASYESGFKSQKAEKTKVTTPIDVDKQFVKMNEEKTDITDSVFREAKDFRQVKNVINKYRKEKQSSYDGKAYSVVQELREKNQGSSNIDEYKITYDSQGYRVLKHQVPQLEHASRLDIIRLVRKNVLYDGHDIVAINKPYGLPSHGGPGVKHSVGQILDAVIPSTKLHLVHRLDKETTGVMLLAKSTERMNELQQMFQKQEMRKRYLVITKGYPSSPKGLIDIPIAEGKVGDKYRMTLRPYRSPEINPVLKTSQEGTTAKTLYRVLDSKHMTSLIECIALTGLKHQIRVHLAFGLNCPILGDHKYAHLDKIAPMNLHGQTLEKLKIRQTKVRYVPMHLHARSIMIPHLLDGKHLFISAPLPYSFVNNMRSLRLKLPPSC